MSEVIAGGGVSAARTHTAEAPPSGGGDGADGTRIYLRTVYPLNPGIPHYLDFPPERERAGACA